MDFVTVGAVLRAEREKRGLSIDNVASRLKILPRQIKALESGDVSSLPHMAYTKGFIRSYASFLGMSKEDLQRSVDARISSADSEQDAPDAATKPEPEKTPAKPAEPAQPANAKETEKATTEPIKPEPEQTKPIKAAPEKTETADPVKTDSPKAPVKPAETVKIAVNAGPTISDASLPAPKRSSGGKGLVFFIIFALLCGGAYYAYDAGYLDAWLSKPETETDLSDQLPRADDFMAQKDREETERAARAPVETPVREPAPAPIFESPADPAKELVERRVEPTPKTDAESSETARSPQTSSPANENPAPAPIEQHNLIITAVEECWVHSSADKTDTRQFSLRKGDTFALSFSESLELKLGNAGGVRLRYDGVDLPAPGYSGQVRTIVFPPKSDL